MMNYTVGDYIIRLKNAAHARRKVVAVPYAKLLESVSKVLVKEHFLSDMKKEDVDGKKMLVVTLYYEERKPTIRGVALISKPSLRVYADKTKTKKNFRGQTGTIIVSTSNGIMTGKEASQKGVGGELLFTIW